MPLGNPIRKQNESRMVSVLATEGQTVFTVQGGYIINHLSVFRNGVRLSPAEDFTAGDGSTVTLNNAANINDRIDFHVFDRFTVQNAIIGAASTQTINGDLVLNGKLFAQLDVPSISLTGIVTATELDLNGKGDISGDLNVVGVTTVGKQVHVGTGVSIAAGGLNVTAGISTFQAVQGTTGTFSAAVSGTTGTFSGAVSGTTGTFSSAVSGTTGTFSDDVTVTGSNKKFISNSTSSGDYVRVYAGGGTGKWDIYGNGADLRFSDNDSAGVVRFDTDVSIADKIIHTGDTDTAIRFPAADTITAETGGSERVRIDSSGRVYVGLSTNSNNLVTLYGPNGDTAIVMQNNATGTGSGNGFYLGNGAGTIAYVWNYENDELRLATNNTERFRIGASGQFGIGGATYGSSGQVLTSGGSGSAPTWSTISGTTINSNTNNYIITGTGTANTLQGESGLTYDGDNLNVSAGAHDSGLHITAANNNQETRFSLIGKASDGTSHTFLLNAKRSANRLDLVGGGQTRASLKSTGEFGIGTVIQESLLTVGGGTVSTSTKSTVHIAPSSGDAMLTLRGGSPQIFFDITSGGNPKIYTDGADLTISNGTLDSAGNERFRFRGDGGLCFNGDTAAANALDDYEEGTYTPRIVYGMDPDISSNSSAYATADGFYRKIGSLVEFNFYIRIANNSAYETDGNQIRFNLPITQNSSGNLRGHGIITYHNINGVYPNSSGVVALYVSGNTAESYDGSDPVRGGNGDSQAHRYFIGGGHYYAS